MLNPDHRPISALLNIHMALEHIMKSQAPMPDAAMDLLVQSGSVIAEMLLEHPVSCEADVADKFRFLASLLEEEAGEMYIENPAMERACADLVALRRDQWQGDFGKPHPRYGRAA